MDSLIFKCNLTHQSTQDQLSWCIWLYKDIGLQGMVHVSPSSPYMKLQKDFLRRKHYLAADAWGRDETNVRHLYDPLVDLVKSVVVDESHLILYPTNWTLEERITRISRTMLLAEFLVEEWADLFHGLDEGQLEELAKSFAFENCVEREGLNKALREYS